MDDFDYSKNNLKGGRMSMTVEISEKSSSDKISFIKETISEISQRVLEPANDHNSVSYVAPVVSESEHKKESEK